MMSPGDSDSPDEPAPDWLGILRQVVESSGDVIDLTALSAGDVLDVITGHTVYRFTLSDPVRREARLQCSRSDRPSGRVRIMGCTIGQSSTIAPDRLFCGGNLEFTFENGRMTHTTTTIRALRWIHPG